MVGILSDSPVWVPVNPLPTTALTTSKLLEVTAFALGPTANEFQKRGFLNQSTVDERPA